MDIATLFRGALHLADAVVPARCLGCARPVTAPLFGPGALCPECFGQVSFIAGVVCEICGRPLEGLSVGETYVCGACARLSSRHPVSRSRSALVYDGLGKDLILKFKHADRTDAAPVLARWMVRAGEALLADADLLVPVPLHWRRLFLRRYNQAALLAWQISRLSRVPVDVTSLLRARATPSQGHLGARRRHENVSGAFVVRRPQVFENKRILLIDDVMTTGATLSSCARVLLNSGAKDVEALTLARVPSHL